MDLRRFTETVRTLFMSGKFDDILPYAYCRESTLWNTYELACSCIRGKIGGAFVECGVAQGAQVGVMLRALRDNRVRRPVYLLDSFEGIPLCSDKDGLQPGIGNPKHDVTLPERDRLVSSGISIGEIKDVKNNLVKWAGDYDECVFIKGWFQDTVERASKTIGDIAILRLDGDLYESTLVCLQSLYENIVNGGYVIIDDYALGGCRSAVIEYFGGEPNYTVVPNTEKVVWWQKI